jgi:hypothetical protein
MRFLAPEEGRECKITAVAAMQEDDMSAESSGSAQPCWWCGSSPAAGTGAIFELYNNVKREYAGPNKTKLSWQSLKVPIPRCERCRRKHGAAAGLPVVFAALFLGLSGLLIYVLTRNWLSESGSDTKMWLSIFFLIVVVCGWIGYWVGGRIGNAIGRSAGSHPYAYGANHPGVAPLIAQGWNPGRPSQN